MANEPTLADHSRTTPRYLLSNHGTGWKYGPWVIQPADWTRPHPSIDWDWCHQDYDGPGDTRCGSAESRDACIEAIHEWEDDRD